MSYVVVGTAWGFARQTGYGDRPTVDKFIPFISETVAQNYDQLEIVDSENRYKKDHLPQGRKRVEGDINTYVESKNIGYPLYYLMGSVSSGSGAVAGSYEYTFDPGDEIDYFTSQFKYGTFPSSKGKAAYDMKMKGATFDFGDETLTATWNVHGADYSGKITAASPAYPTGRKFNMKDASIKITPQGGSETTVKIKSGSIEVDNGLITDDYYQGSQTVQQLAAGKFSVRGTMELIMDNSVALDDWLEGEKKAKVVVKYVGDTIADTAKHTLEFIIPNCWCGTHDVNMTNNEVIVRNVEFEGFYDGNAAAGNKTLRIKLLNGSNIDYSA